MLERYDLRKLTVEELKQFALSFEEELALAKRRLAALRRTEAARPEFKNFNPLAEDFVGIDIYIEEWEAVQGELKDQLRLIAKEHDRRRGLNQTIRMF